MLLEETAVISFRQASFPDNEIIWREGMKTRGMEKLLTVVAKSSYSVFLISVYTPYKAVCILVVSPPILSVIPCIRPAIYVPPDFW